MRLLLLAITGISVLFGETVVPGRVTMTEAGVLPRLTSILNQNEVPVARKLAMASAATGHADTAEAESVLAAALKAVNRLLAVPIGNPSSVATLVDRGEDVLVARWSGNEITETVTPVLLWDDSISDTIIFRCSPKLITSPANAEQLLNRMHLEPQACA